MRALNATKPHLFTAFALLAISSAGCASWSDRATDQLAEKPSLPTLKQNLRSLILHVEFVAIEVDEASPDQIQSLWQWVDETNVDANLRCDLAANGLRAGRVLRNDRFRARLKSLQSGDDVVEDFSAQADVASEVYRGGDRIPMRMGRRYELPVRQPIEGAHVAMVRLDGELVGKTLQDPQFLFAVTPTSGKTPQQVNVRLRPEIQHGAMRQHWVSSDAALRIDTRRQTWSLESLDLNLEGVENDTFVIGSVNPGVGLGKQMFGGKSADNRKQQVLVLITLGQVPTTADQL